MRSVCCAADRDARARHPGIGLHTYCITAAITTRKLRATAFAAPQLLHANRLQVKVRAFFKEFLLGATFLSLPFPSLVFPSPFPFCPSLPVPSPFLFPPPLPTLPLSLPFLGVQGAKPLENFFDFQMLVGEF
jgi:hypothetical protein